MFLAGQRLGGQTKPAKFKQYSGGGGLEAGEGGGEERTLELVALPALPTSHCLPQVDPDQDLLMGQRPGAAGGEQV